MTTHDYLIKWGFKYSDLDNFYSLLIDHTYVRVELNKDNISRVVLSIGSSRIEAPNLKCRSQLFNFLYSFDLLK